MTIESIDAQIAKLEAQRAALKAEGALSALVAQGMPRGLAQLVLSDPDAAVRLGRAIEWTARETPPREPIPVVEGYTVTKRPQNAGVDVAGKHAATLTNREARDLGHALIRAGHHAESGLL